MQLRRAKERAIRLQQSDIREVTSGMNPAQKRRWNAYSTRKKQKLFGQARRAAKKKRRYQRAALEEQRWGRERPEYRTAAFKKSTPEENDRGSSQKRVETQSATTCWQSQVGVQATTVSWQSREGLRQKAPETDSRPPNRIEKRRDRKSESTIRELLGLVDRDIRRTEGIKQDIRSEQIQMSEAEYETAKTVAATSLIPLRLRYERTRRDVRSAMQRAGFSLARYLVPLSGLFFLVVLLYAILMGLIGGLAGSEAEESTMPANGSVSRAMSGVPDEARQQTGRIMRTVVHLRMVCLHIWAMKLVGQPMSRNMQGHWYRVAFPTHSRATSFCFTLGVFRRVTVRMLGFTPGTDR